jgi:outer membrane protein assembly factor BamE
MDSNFAKPAHARLAPLAWVFAMLLMAGCSGVKIPGVYRIDIQQGNVVTQEMIDQLEPGMDRRKVRFILGTPLLTDTFNEDRWDYIYSYQRGGGKRVQRRVSVYFENERLAKVEGDVRAGATRRPVLPRQETIVSVPPSSDDEGFFAGLKPDFFNREKKPKAAEKPAETPQAAETQEAETREAGTPETEAQEAGTQEAEAPSPAPSAETSATEAAELAAILPTEPQPTASSPQDQAYLEQLFEGFGKAEPRRAGSASVVVGGRSELADTSEEDGSAVYEDDDLGIEDTSLQDPTAAKSETESETQSEDTKPSIFTRLLNRLRQGDEKEAAEPPGPEAPSRADDDPEAL